MTGIFIKALMKGAGRVSPTIKSVMKGAGKVSPTIKSVKPNVPTTKKEKALSKLNILKQKTKTSSLKLKNTLADIKEKATKRENKMGGGMMGRRMGYSQGSKDSKKSNLGMQSVKHGLDNNPNITAADPKAKFIARAKKVGNGKPKKKIKKQVI
jgi:hypothetical protein